MTAPLHVLTQKWSAPRIRELTSVGRVAVAASGRAYFLAGLAKFADRPILAIVSGERDAEELADDLELFAERVHFLPAWETLPFEHVSPNTFTMARRSAARYALAAGEAGTIVVGSVRAATQRISPSPTEPLELSVGSSIDFEDVATRLVDMGYLRVDRAEARGEFAVRGGIIDVFGADQREPSRIEFWGDYIETLRTFSAATQRSSNLIETMVAYPAREFRADSLVKEMAQGLIHSERWAAATWDRVAQGVTFPGLESWMPWLADERTAIEETRGQVVLFDPVRSQGRSTDLVKEESDLAAALAPTWGAGAPGAGEHPTLYLDLGERLVGREVLEVPPLAAGPQDDALDVRSLDAPAGDAVAISGAISGLIRRSITVVVAMDGAVAADRVTKLLGDEGIHLPRMDALTEIASAASAMGIHKGFVIPSLGVAVLGEQQIAGRRRAHRRSTGGRKSESAANYRDLVPGDYVVHHRHGIGHFEGLVTRAIAGVERDYLTIAYAGDDKLYVPTDQLAAVQKYNGGGVPRVSRMGGADWEKAKGKVRKAVAVVAEEVVWLHRQRAAATGYSYGPDTPWQTEMESAFPFEETPDQLTAIADIKRDMQNPKPMDRLIFGDVGFGKTEVAVRAAFKAVNDGKQVAVLCPTTLLAQQHFQVFLDRFAGYPMRVEVLSRFLTGAEQRHVVKGLANGEVDLVVGTHRILSDSVEFKNIGLVIIDEEQRFGVGAKDKLKRLKVGVDVLALTATPIPRTLEMAMTGVRDVSQIHTPPGDRHPILTYVGPLDESSISAAIRREMLREGQVFFVHNRVQSIDRAVVRLQKLVPDARIAVAHGQMNEGQLEQVMLDFWSREHDVLVATTIIESGLDIPQVNTLIVERADMLGLAQLYQLRGRVGRSNTRAYAYLFHSTDQTLSETAYRRLEAIGEHAQLGSGFHLAARDLEIRGAGSMLGEVQSGHISAVGFDLYCKLVADAVGELEGFEMPDSPQIADIRIDLHVDAHLPDFYIDDQLARIEAYRRLASAASQEEVEDVAAEWVDRYGNLPESAQTLISMARLRSEALRVGLKEILKLKDEIRMGPVDLSVSQEVRLRRLAPKSVLRAGENILFFSAPSADNLTESVSDFIRAMWPLAESIS